ncbi:MAG: endonuclease/exonuclease/phosphatase family protein [Bdellovibrionaceae bacterium]|nr:endonuclease/exonuclease/phosphatase family protein [Bdellovibrio sp.]
MKLKILSYNIHKGFDWGKRNYFLQDMKDLITSSQADIVFLQEVVGQSDKYKEKGLIDTQFEFLADSIWEHYSYARNALYDHGHHGNLILSRYPIESWENINLTTNVLEKRGLLVCKINIPHTHKNIYVACVHLDLLQRGRVIQYEMIKKKIQSLEIEDHLPLVVAGDFNDWNKKCTTVFEGELGMHEAYKTTHGRFAKTFPAGFPMLTLDRIYLRNLDVLDSKILPKPNTNHFSDHLPLFCEVEINEA